MKGIIVVNYPNSCSICDLCYESDYDLRYRFEGEKFCGITQMNVDEYREDRPAWCPITPILEE